MPKHRPAVQAVFFSFDGTLTRLRRAQADLAAEGASQMTRWLREQGLDLPADFAEQWLAARRFAAEKSRQARG